MRSCRAAPPFLDEKKRGEKIRQGENPLKDFEDGEYSPPWNPHSRLQRQERRKWMGFEVSCLMTRRESFC